MSFQDAKLPAQVIANMYKSTLIQDLTASEQEHPEPPEKKSAFEFKGKNEKSIAVVVACRQKLSETSSEIVFLLKILKACNLGIDDIALIDVKSIEMDLDKFVSEFTPERVLIFSTTFNNLPIPESICFEVQKSGQAEVVYAPEVQAMQADSSEAVLSKKKLWTVLKNFFNV